MSLAKKYYCYSSHPIDYYFGSKRIDIVKLELWEEASGATDYASVIQLFKRLREQVNKNEGGECFDEVRYVHLFAVPSEVQMEIGLVVKVCNNGHCYIASPVVLPNIACCEDFGTFEMNGA